MKKISILLALACLLSGYAYSQKIPFLNNIQQYNIKEGDINKMRINVYSVKNENGKISTNALADYATHITFDSLGNRVKEVIYNYDAKMLHTNIWDYNAVEETVGRYQLNELNQEMGKKIYDSNTKEKTVNIKRYGTGDTLLIEEQWMVGATGKTINLDRYTTDTRLNIIGKKTSSTYNIEDGKSIEYLVTNFGAPENYLWWPDFMHDWENAKNKKTRIEKLTDGSQIVYTYDEKKQLMIEKKNIDPQGKASYIMSYEYEFDGNGNWTKVTQFTNGQASIIGIRTFEYRLKPIAVKKR